jgi:uncharacterized OB-fold protein
MESEHMDDAVAPAKPLPVPDAVTAGYWTAAAEGALAIQHCASCAAFTFPPLTHCPRCLGSLQWRRVSGRGTVHSYCRMWEALVPGFTPPYVVVVVELDDAEGVRITGNLVGAADGDGDAYVGQRVEVVFERRDGVTLPQFRSVGQKVEGSV